MKSGFCSHRFITDNLSLNCPFTNCHFALECISLSTLYTVHSKFIQYNIVILLYTRLLKSHCNYSIIFFFIFRIMEVNNERSEIQTPITDKWQRYFQNLHYTILTKKKPDLMIMRSGFHFHHNETWFQKKPGLTNTSHRACESRTSEQGPTFRPPRPREYTPLHACQLGFRPPGGQATCGEPAYARVGASLWWGNRPPTP